jgi:Bacterial protein of unknown function (DUF885)
MDRYIAWPGQAISYYMGELVIVCAREKAEKTFGANGADGISDIEGKVARVATSKLGNERVSNSTSALFTMPCSSSARYPLPVVTARIDRFITEGGKGPYPDME